DDDVAEVLSIPLGMTQIAMIPVAWAKGTEFSRAPRYPAREIAFIDQYAHTWERGPSDPPKLSDGPGTIVEIDIDATPGGVWPFVSDINFPAEFSEEFLGAQWSQEGVEATIGSEFIGSNTHPAIGEWEIPCVVTHYHAKREFGWATRDAENPGARWRFELSAIAGACRLRYSVALGPGPSGLTRGIEAKPDREPQIISNRLDQLRSNMQNVIEGIKQAAEQTAG
ncbi:MAG: SRPBCC family protein, partial [Acidimicrobiales bacterium]